MNCDMLKLVKVYFVKHTQIWCNSDTEHDSGLEHDSCGRLQIFLNLVNTSIAMLAE